MGDNTFSLIIQSYSGSILKSVTSPLGPLLCNCIRTIWGLFAPQCLLDTCYMEDSFLALGGQVYTSIIRVKRELPE